MADRKQYLKDYQRNWVASRRAEFFTGKQCTKCGSTQRLELDHIDPEDKTDHAIWSWSETRRLRELAKCQILCNSCHKEKSAGYCRAKFSGIPKPGLRKLTDNQITAIRAGHSTPERTLAINYKVGKTTIHTIKTRELYMFPVDIGKGAQIRTEDLLLPRQTD